MTDQSALVARLAQHRTLREAPREELVVARASTARCVTSSAAIFSPPISRSCSKASRVVLSGHFAIYVDHGAGPHKVMEWTGGDVTGLLPYSRMTKPIGDHDRRRTDRRVHGAPAAFSRDDPRVPDDHRRRSST